MVANFLIGLREGLEAVLILAALLGGMTGAQSVLRRPLLAGAAAALCNGRAAKEVLCLENNPPARCHI